MKSRTQGKSVISHTQKKQSANEKNFATNIKNHVNIFFDLMNEDGTLTSSSVKRIMDNSYKTELFKFNDIKQFHPVLERFNETRNKILDQLEEADGLTDFKNIFNKNISVLDLSKVVTAMLAEIQFLSKKTVEYNYLFLGNQIDVFPKKDLVGLNFSIYKKENESESEEEKIKRLKKEFQYRAIVPVYTSTTNKIVEKEEKKLNNIWNIDELIKVQKPEDIMEFATNDEVKFKILFLYAQYAYRTYKEFVYNNSYEWQNNDELHRNKEGYIVEAEALKGLLTPEFISSDKLVLISGFRALECLENEDYPIDKDRLISMIIEIEKYLKDKDICLQNKFDVQSYNQIVNSNIEIVAKKLANGKLKKQDLKDMYIQGKTTYQILKTCVSAEELSESVSPEEFIEEYKKYKKDSNNSDRFFRIAKLYRDNRIQYKTDKGEILDGEFEFLRTELNNLNDNEGIIDFLKMGIFDISTIIGFDDEKIIMDAFLSGAFSKSDIQTITDFEIIKTRKLKEELNKLEDGSNKTLLNANLSDYFDNPKRNFIYSLNPEAKSMNAGEGDEIFFINDWVIITDSLSENINSGKNTIIINKNLFEEEFGINGCNTSKLFNKKTNGEISINKIARKTCDKKGISFSYSKNWCDIMMQVVVGDEEKRKSIYDEQDLAEQRRTMKIIEESLEK